MINLVQNGVIILCVRSCRSVFSLVPNWPLTSICYKGLGFFVCVTSSTVSFSNHILCQERLLTNYGWFWNSLEFFFGFNYQEFSALVLISKKGPKCTNKKWVPLYPGLGRP